MVALLSVAFCAVLALTAHTGGLAVAAAMVVAQLLLAGSVFAGQCVPGPRLAAVVVAGGGLLACAATLRPDAVSTEDVAVQGTLAGLAPAAAAVIVASLLAQMLRRDGRGQLTRSLSATVTLGVLSVLLASWVAAAQGLMRAQGLASAEVVIVAAAAVAVASVALSLPGRPALAGVLAALGATAAATAVCLVLPGAPVWQFGVALGLTAGLLTIAGRLLGRAWSAVPAHRVPIEALAPLALVGPVVVIANQLFVH